MRKPVVYFDRHLASINSAVKQFFENDADISFEIENRAGYWAPLKDTVKWYLSFIKRLKNREFDLVHANHSKIALLCRLTKTPYIYSMHGVPRIEEEIKESLKDFILCLIEVFCLKTSHKKALQTTGISDYVCKEAEKKFGFLPDVMYNGYGKPDSVVLNKKIKNSYISVGRLDPCKNPLRVLCVFKSILEKQPDAKLVYLGRGSMEAVFKKKIIEYGLSSNVTYKGFVVHEAIAEYYNEASYFISACEIEGFGLAALEALSYGCKPLLPKAGAFPEIFTDETFFYGDDNIVDLTPLDTKKQEEILKKFTWEKSLTKWKETYLSHLKKS